MNRPDPIQYAERLYAAIRAANFSPISFLAFGSAVKDGVEFRRMPRLAAEPFMRVVGEMLDLHEEHADIDQVIHVPQPTDSEDGQVGATSTNPTAAGDVSAAIASGAAPPTQANTESIEVTTSRAQRR